MCSAHVVQPLQILRDLRDVGQRHRKATTIVHRAGLTETCPVVGRGRDVLFAARPVLILTSDPDDLSTLVQEPDQPEDHRVAIVHT